MLQIDLIDLVFLIPSHWLLIIDSLLISSSCCLKRYRWLSREESLTRWLLVPMVVWSVGRYHVWESIMSIVIGNSLSRLPSLWLLNWWSVVSLHSLESWRSTHALMQNWCAFLLLWFDSLLWSFGCSFKLTIFSWILRIWTNFIEDKVFCIIVRDHNFMRLILIAILIYVNLLILLVWLLRLLSFLRLLQIVVFLWRDHILILCLLLWLSFLLLFSLSLIIWVVLCLMILPMPWLPVIQLMVLTAVGMCWGARTMKCWRVTANHTFRDSLFSLLFRNLLSTFACRGIQRILALFFWRLLHRGIFPDARLLAARELTCLLLDVGLVNFVIWLSSRCQLHYLRGPLSLRVESLWGI